MYFYMNFVTSALIAILLSIPAANWIPSKVVTGAFACALASSLFSIVLGLPLIIAPVSATNSVLVYAIATNSRRKKRDRGS